MIDKRIVAIIPARFESSRFPGKPLVDISGKTMIQRVYEQVSKVEALQEVCVATDDERIFKEVIEFGGKAVMTSNSHQSGTDRCHEAVHLLDQSFDFVINVQGDEPFIQVSQIKQLAKLMLENNAEIGTLIKEVRDYASLTDSNIPKVVINKQSEAIYFSRQTIPYIRGVEKVNWSKSHIYYKHIGMYGYRVDILEELSKLLPSSLETAEALEQLRWIENGYKIKVGITEFDSHGIDTPEQLEAVKSRFLEG